LAEGVSEKEILEDYPYLEQEDIRACHHRQLLKSSSDYSL